MGIPIIIIIIFDCLNCRIWGKRRWWQFWNDDDGLSLPLLSTPFGDDFQKSANYKYVKWGWGMGICFPFPPWPRTYVACMATVTSFCVEIVSASVYDCTLWCAKSSIFSITSISLTTTPEIGTYLNTNWSKCLISQSTVLYQIHTKIRCSILGQYILMFL